MEDNWSGPVRLTRKSIGPVALEAVLIVASILLAFAIDAAWDRRDEHRREHDLLLALEADFQQNGRLLQEARAVHESHRDAALEFLAAASPDAESGPRTVSDATLISLVSWYTYDPVLGGLNSAIASGRLTLISDDVLRTALSGWVDSVEDLKELEVVDRGHSLRFADAAFDHVAFRSVVYQLGASEYGRPSTAQTDYDALLGSLRAENIATNRVAEIGFILEDLSRVESQLDTIMELIRSNLE